MRNGAATDAGFGDGRLKFDVSEEAAPEVFGSAISPRAKRRACYLFYHGFIADGGLTRVALYWLTHTMGDFFIWACCCLSSRATRPRETLSGCGKSEGSLSP